MTHPFHLSVKEIGNLTFRQATILIDEYNKDRSEKMKAHRDICEKYGKNAFPIIDLTKGIF